MISSLLSVILVLVIVGVVLYLVENFIPMAQPFKLAIRVVVVLVLCIWLLSLLGVAIPIRLR